MSITSRTHAFFRLTTIALAVATAACFGGRTKKPAAPPTTARVTRPESATVDSAKAKRDSTVADSLAKAAANAVRDSIKRDSIAHDSANRRVVDSTATKAKTKTSAGKDCLLDFTESPPESRAVYYRQNATASNVFIGGGFVGHCRGEKNRIRADSAEHFQEPGFLNLFGNVTYEEGGTLRVTANHATYFTREGKLFADGNVVATQLKSGSTFTGPNMEYYRVLPGTRPVARLYAPNNPRARLTELDKGANAGPPIFMTASTMESRDDTLIMGWGQVQFTREQVVGNSDSASFAKLTGRARLIRQGRIQSRDKDRPFVMIGDTIDLFTSTKDRVLNQIVARHRSNVTSSDMQMQAEIVDLRLTDQKISRAFAFGPGRATTHASGQTLVADSMDILLPSQRIQELRAIGTAVVTGLPDTTKMKSDELDELHGDTVLAFFDSLKSPSDTNEKPKIRQVQARGSATSKFQIASNKGKTFPPAISYARGKRIVLAFDSGEVRNVFVDSTASGIYLEPETDSLSDSSKKAVKPPVRRPPEKPTTPEGAPTPFLQSPAHRRRQ